MYYSHVDALKPHTIENTVQDPAKFNQVWKPLFCATKQIYLIDLSKEKRNEKLSVLHEYIWVIALKVLKVLNIHSLYNLAYRPKFLTSTKI